MHTPWNFELHCEQLKLSLASRSLRRHYFNRRLEGWGRRRKPKCKSRTGQTRGERAAPAIATSMPPTQTQCQHQSTLTPNQKERETQNKIGNANQIQGHMDMKSVTRKHQNPHKKYQKIPKKKKMHARTRWQNPSVLKATASSAVGAAASKIFKSRSDLSSYLSISGK